METATILRRRDRFTAFVKVGEAEGLAHIADSGRLTELVYPGNAGMVRRVDLSASTRLTAYDLVLAAYGQGNGGEPVWVSIDTRYPNKVFLLALRSGLVPEFLGYDQVRPEFTYVPENATSAKEPGAAGPPKVTGVSFGKGGKKRPVQSRIDFLLRGEGLPPALVEVKSVNLCVDGRGLFPDAPTSRGARHLRELMRAVKEGYLAYAVFVAQREDIRSISPNRDTDPVFADTLKEAQEAGVRLLGFRCLVTPAEIRLDPGPLPVVLD